MQSVSITTDVVSSNLDQGEVYNIICFSIGLWTCSDSVALFVKLENKYCTLSEWFQSPIEKWKNNIDTLSEKFQNPIEKTIMPHCQNSSKVQYSDSVTLLVSLFYFATVPKVGMFVFLLDFGPVPTVWHYLFFYWTLDLFRQRGIICFLWDFGPVPTIMSHCQNISKVPYKTGKQILHTVGMVSKSDRKMKKQYWHTVGKVPKSNRKNNNATLSNRHYLFFHFAIGLWNHSDSEQYFFSSFIWDFGNVLTVWHYWFLYFIYATLSEQVQSPIEKQIMPHCRNRSKVQ
jgi:hypothetical protein